MPFKAENGFFASILTFDFPPLRRADKCSTYGPFARLAEKKQGKTKAIQTISSAG